ncbi:TPA: hypothetical protein ACF5TK_000836 [Klebsiella pneumoniae]
MKYIAAAAATLSLADGTKFGISPGIHDATDFPDDVKQHWAFPSCVQPVDEADLEKEKQGDDLAAKNKALTAEIEVLKAQLAERDSTVAALTTELKTLKAPADDNAESGKNAKKQQASN